MKYQTIHITKHKNYSLLRLSRPEVRNAMNGLMLDELIYFLENAHSDGECKLLVVRGEGKVFSAGADLNWMAEGVNASYNENVKESSKLYRVFELFNTLPMVTVAWLHGAAIGGALGIAAGADFLWIDEDVKVRFSEVKLGLVPATVAPFIVNRIGEIRARQWMLSARMLTSNELLEAGFADGIVNANQLPDQLTKLIDSISGNDLNAMRITKKLLHDIVEKSYDSTEKEYTSRTIAEARASDAAQGRIKHFLETKNITS
jgi:methylglutaconyl-CoA hydratase